MVLTSVKNILLISNADTVSWFKNCHTVRMCYSWQKHFIKNEKSYSVKNGRSPTFSHHGQMSNTKIAEMLKLGSNASVIHLLCLWDGALTDTFEHV